MIFNIIVAYDQNRGIGKNNMLPWQLPEDMKRFAKLTKGESADKQNAVIMGRKTWESIPEKFRPLPGRINVVLSRQVEYNLPNGVLHFSSLNDALSALENEQINQIFLIGGSSLYAEGLQHPQCKNIFVTEIKGTFECDTFFPALPDTFSVIEKTDFMTSEKNIEYRFLTLSKS